MRLVRVPPESVDDVWPLAEPYLKKAEERSNGASLNATRESAKGNLKQLWFAAEDTPEQPNKVFGVAVTSLVKRENGDQDMIIELLGGEKLDAWFTLKEELEDWARLENRKGIEVWCRKALLRKLPDYKITHYVLRKEL